MQRDEAQRTVGEFETVPSNAPASALAPAPARATASILDLQRTAGNAAVTRLLRRSAPASRTLTRVPDQHAGTREPSARQLTGIEAELNPTSARTSGGNVWDGDASNPDHLANRAALATELTAALDDALRAEMPRIHAVAAAPPVALTTFEGAGLAAKRVVDEKFGALAAASALTSSQETARSTFSFTAGANLVDVTDPAEYTPDAADVADWMAQTDRRAQRVQRRHRFNKDRSADEQAFLDNDIIAPFAAAHTPDLEKFDKFGFGMQDDGKVFIVPRVQASRGFPATAPASGAPSSAERKARWDMWQLLVHEYIHTLEHPEFLRARGANRILYEGFCEMFTEEVLHDWIPKARADADLPLRTQIEGKAPSGSPWPGFRRAFVSPYDPGDYAEFARHAKRIRRILGAGGENAVRAAFFQGHIELIGRTEAGGMAAAPSVPADQVTVPPGVTTLAALAAMTGVSERSLKRANPGLRGPAVTPGAALRAPGCRFHVVVQADDVLELFGFSVAIDQTPEAIGKIATQNGVTPADLMRANPGMDFAALQRGDRVLIPKH